MQPFLAASPVRMILFAVLLLLPDSVMVVVDVAEVASDCCHYQLDVQLQLLREHS